MIIAEIAQNFANINEAKKLIKLAKECGADLVKAQLFNAQRLYGKPSPFELSKEQAHELFEFGAGQDMEVFFSVFDTEMVEWCEEIGVSRYKVACRLRNDAELLKAIEKTGKPIIISSYKPTFYDTMFYVGREPEDLAWSIPFDLFDGVSDHTVGLDIVKIALARGATIIEKHFCFSHSHGIDAKWGMTPSELRELKRWELLCQKVL